MSASAGELEQLRREAGSDGGELRFQQGDGPVADAFTLVDNIHTLFSVSLVAPKTATLVWNDTLGRLWACDCVDHAMPAAEAAIDDPTDLRLVKGSIRVARQYAQGDADLGILDGHFKELFVEEWPTYEGPFANIVEAARHATARNEGAHSYPGVGTIFEGKWAATAAREAREAVSDHDAERRWQAARLLDYLLLGRSDGPITG